VVGFFFWGGGSYGTYIEIGFYDAGVYVVGGVGVGAGRERGEEPVSAMRLVMACVDVCPKCLSQVSLPLQA
jgi:hypothetical protein